MGLKYFDYTMSGILLFIVTWRAKFVAKGDESLWWHICRIFNSVLLTIFCLFGVPLMSKLFNWTIMPLVSDNMTHFLRIIFSVCSSFTNRCLWFKLEWWKMESRRRNWFWFNNWNAERLEPWRSICSQSHLLDSRLVLLLYESLSYKACTKHACFITVHKNHITSFY